MKKFSLLIFTIFLSVTKLVYAEEIWTEEELKGDNVVSEYRYRFYEEVEEGEYLENNNNKKYEYNDESRNIYGEYSEWKSYCSTGDNIDIQRGLKFVYNEIIPINYLKIENNNNTEKTQSNENKEIKFTAPVNGEILREFAKDSLVYSNTLEEWITHTGVDIKADKTTVVKAAANGKVESIKNDPRYGLTVIVSHSGGYKTVYANLLTAEYVVEGEEIEAGQTIGTVGNSSSFEIADDYHLHFELIKDGEYLNPCTLMEF